MKNFQEPFVAEHELNIEGETMRAKIDGWRVFFRAQNWPQDVLGFAPENQCDLVLKGFWTRSWELKECERVIPLSDALATGGEDWFLALADAQITRLHYRQSADERFSCTSCDLKSVIAVSEAQRWTLPTEELLMQLQRDLNDPQSVLKQAAAFLRLPAVEQQWAQVQFESGTREQLELVAKAIMQICPDAYANLNVRYIWCQFSPVEPLKFEFARDMAHLREWNNCLNHLFRAKKVPLPFWVSNEQYASYRLSIRIPVQSPSRHEQTEALLFLKRWAKDGMTCEDLQKLLSTS